jgi:pimeloyl-ACP methyl ester carboxylesterase
MLATSMLVACAALAKLEAASLPNQTTVISSARMNAATPATSATASAPASPALPEHCEVIGKMNERIGFNSQHYAINFRLRLPTGWNGRFFFEGGGGTNGGIGNALGRLPGQLPTNALALGYAVVAQDSGHDNTINNNPLMNGEQTFGFDPQARLDLGYQSYDAVTQAAKALIRMYYGKPPEKSYYAGCSEGGRQALMMSQRFPEHFDGILAVGPGINIPKATTAAAWDTQTLAAVAKESGLVDRSGQPFVNKVFTDDDLALAGEAIIGACDALDGLADGIVDDFPRCTTAVVKSKLDAVTCAGKRGKCLTAAQVEALVTIFDGPKDSQGRATYTSWPWDAGIGHKPSMYLPYFSWRSWKMGPYDAMENSALNATFISSATSAILATPPVPRAMHGADLAKYMIDVPVDDHVARSAASGGIYRESGDSFMKADSTDISRFTSRGGKIVVVHGVSDGIFSINDSIAWLKGVDAAQGGKAADAVRLFAVPGMGHCLSGPATDQFDAFTALVDWVEKSAAPDRIVAKARPQSPWPGRTRPLCAYPKQARYSGAGSIEDAANFVCK